MSWLLARPKPRPRFDRNVATVMKSELKLSLRWMPMVVTYRQLLSSLVYRCRQLIIGSGEMFTHRFWKFRVKIAYHSRTG